MSRQAAIANRNGNTTRKTVPNAACSATPATAETLIPAEGCPTSDRTQVDQASPQRGREGARTLTDSVRARRDCSFAGTHRLPNRRTGSPVADLSLSAAPPPRSPPSMGVFRISAQDFRGQDARIYRPRAGGWTTILNAARNIPLHASGPEADRRAVRVAAQFHREAVAFRRRRCAIQAQSSVSKRRANHVF